MKTATKETAKNTTKLPKLATPERIAALIERAVKSSRKAHEYRHAAAIQALMHFEKHGDTSLIAALMDGLRTCPGVLVPAYTKWFTDNSPVKLSVDNGSVKAVKDKGPNAKPFRVERANNTPAEQTAEAKAALSRPLPDLSAAYYRGRLTAMLKGLDKATGSDSKRTVDGDPAILNRALTAALTAFERSLKPVAVKPAEQAKIYKPEERHTASAA